MSVPQAPASGLGAPKIDTENTDAAKFMKLAERVEQVLTHQAKYQEPKQLDPNRVLVSPMNRLGATPNVKHVHFGILQSIKKNSYDRTRPAPGICVEYTSEAGIKELLEHNRRFSSGNRLLPSILENAIAGGPVYGSLAGTHLNLALRCLKNDVPSPIGSLEPLLRTHAGLKEVALNGHRWIILPETVDKNYQIDISLWRNQDQNENHAINEVEILQTISVVSKDLVQRGRTQVNAGDLAVMAQRRNPAKVGWTSWDTLTKYYCSFVKDGLADLVDDLIDFHAECVNPRELMVSLRMYAHMTTEEAFKTCH